MTLGEAKALILPHLNATLAVEWACTTDSLLWIEYELFPLIDVQSSTCSVFGQALAEFIEDNLDTYLN